MIWCKQMSFWKILRVLVSDICNYQCVFCHNEGQVKPIGKGKLMQLGDFKLLVDALRNSGIVDIEFSGGDPFTNPDTIEMIEYVNSTTSWEIGCATNAQLLNDEIIRRIGSTRTKININLPTLDQRKFHSTTGTGSLTKLQKQLLILDAHKIDYAFNSVFYEDSLDEIFKIINLAALQGRRLKILPYLDVRHPAQPKDTDNLFQYLNELAENATIQPTSRKWVLKDQGAGKGIIKYVDFPCINHDISACREYGEVRVLPDLSIQTCLVNQTSAIPLRFRGVNSNEQIFVAFEKAWDSFISC